MLPTPTRRASHSPFSRTPRRFVAPLLLASLLPAAGCADGHASAGSDQRSAATARADASLSASQADLLELAFDAASALPTRPHLRDRARAQEEVVDACLRLHQPQRALEWGRRIDNWRRGTACAHAAFALARAGDAEAARAALEVAQAAADTPPTDDSQDWQRERILAAIAEARGVLERTGPQAAAARPDAAVIDAQLAALQAAGEVGQLDQTRAALDAAAQLHDAFYADEALRTRLGAAMRAAWRKLPLPIRLELVEQLADSALAHGDKAAVVALAAEAAALVAEGRWRAEDHVPLLARVATLHARGGDLVRARELVTQARELYAAEQQTIVDIFRADSLRPLAEACQALGDTPAALEVWAQAVEAGALNQNARPRAEDLSATCCSLAVQGVQPPAELRARMGEIREGLLPPW